MSPVFIKINFNIKTFPWAVQKRAWTTECNVLVESRCAMNMGKSFKLSKVTTPLQETGGRIEDTLYMQSSINSKVLHTC